MRFNRIAVVGQRIGGLDSAAKPRGHICHTGIKCDKCCNIRASRECCFLAGEFLGITGCPDPLGSVRRLGYFSESECSVGEYRAAGLLCFGHYRPVGGICGITDRQIGDQLSVGILDRLRRSNVLSPLTTTFGHKGSGASEPR